MASTMKNSASTVHALCMPGNRIGRVRAIFYRTIAGITILAATSAIAQDLTADEITVLPRILSAIAVEISAEHNGQERAILLRNADPDAASADLVIIAGAPDERERQPVLIVRDLVFAGIMAGQVPWLEVSPQGSLLVKSEQTGIGRSPWEEALTLAERGGQVVVAGYTLNQWDRITAGSAQCDWNLLSGRWVTDYDIPPGEGAERKGGDSGTESLRITPAEWAARRDSLAPFCRVDLGG